VRTEGSTFSKAGPVSDSPVFRNCSLVWTLFFVWSVSVVVVVVVVSVAQPESMRVAKTVMQEARKRVFIML
jgi:hypothetical protein